MGNENSVAGKNSVTSLPPIRISDSGERKTALVKAARRASDQRQHHLSSQLQQHKQNNYHLPAHRHSTSNTQINSTLNLEPQRKYSQCQPGRYIEDLTRSPQRYISESQCSLSASPSAYSYRSRASFASVGPSPTQPLLASSPNRQVRADRTLTPTNQHSSRPNRRMSVDESQQRRQARGTSATPGNGQVKLSLAGLHGLSINNQGDDQQQNMQPSSRSRINKVTREFNETGDFQLTLQEQLKLSSYQTLMLTQTWSRIKPGVFNGVFRELSQKCPKVKELFQKTSIVGGFSASKCVDMKEHIKQLVELYDASIQGFTSPCKSIQEKCVMVGETHFAIAGPCASGIWDDFGVCLTEAISKADAVRGKREAFKAYIALTSFLVDSMKGGYMAQAKRKSLSRTANGSTQNSR